MHRRRTPMGRPANRRPCVAPAMPDGGRPGVRRRGPIGKRHPRLRSRAQSAPPKVTRSSRSPTANRTDAREEQGLKIERLIVGWFRAPAGIFRAGDDMEKAIRFPVPAYLVETSTER